MVWNRVFALAAFAAWLGATPCNATAAHEASAGTLYALRTPPSSLAIGCLPPCECPVLTIPTYGSFELVPTGSDPLFTYYDVVRFIASFNNGPGAVSITGSGKYKVGGEFALTQQLTLDLNIEGHPTEHFDSGPSPVQVPFPQIDISCAVHGFFCYDSVLVVNAKPADVAGGPPPPARIGLQSLQPNPFQSRISIAFALDHPAPVDLMAVDLEGRRVRVLATGQPAGQASQSVRWDGRTEDGRMAPAGVYWVVMRWAGGLDARRIVKLE